MRKLSNIEYGLMTLSEYLEHRNPQNKYHESGSYTFSVDSMNKDHSIDDFNFVNYHRNDFEYTIKGKRDLSAFFICKNNKVVAVIGGGSIYYSYKRDRNLIFERPFLKGYGSNREYVYFSDMNLREKKVKYPSDYMGLVSDVVKMNTQRYPHLVERFENKGEMFTIRSEKPLKGVDEGVDIGVFNEQGYKVATAQNEWGATLIGVAKEYRSRGLSKRVSKYWYQYNPSRLSGGFTPEGEQMAISYWADRVRELHTEGVYFEKVLKGEMTQDQVDEILADLPPKVERIIENTKVEPTGILAMNDNDHSSFIIYDLAYFKEQDERFIYGYGLLRDQSEVGTFYFQLDYDRQYTDLVTKVALQYAKDLGDTPLFDGEGERYSDILEIEGISGVFKEGDYIHVSRDLIDLKQMRLFDRMVRKKVDTYGEIETLLQEGAYGKWR